MKNHTPFTKSIQPVTNLITRTLWWRAFVLVALMFTATWFALAPQARATCQDACLTNNNTVQGEDALSTLTTGFANTATGWFALHSNTTGGNNTATGSSALYNNTTGGYNTATGHSALFNNTIGGNNTATGEETLFNNTIGGNNTATGYLALNHNTTGNSNTANGFDTLISNTTGNDNTASGQFALFSNTTGSRNAANGSSALYSNQTGGDNTATGFNALYANTANYNTATGYQALESNTTGSNNSAHGIDTLNTNTSGSADTAEGALALFSNTTGGNNTAIGFDALYDNTIGNSNTAVGLGALQSNTTGSSNIALGLNAGYNLTTGSNNIEIGNNGVAGDVAKIRIGTRPTHKNTYIAGIFGVTVPTGVAVLVDNTGHLGTTTSSARFKEAIKPMDKASEAILALKPVTFRYKHELDPDAVPQFGLVAEEVANVNPDLVARDDDGKPYSVRYEAVNAMLLNEFLKEHCKVEGLEATVAEQQSINTELREEVKELKAAMSEQAGQLRKVSDELAVNRSVSRVLAANQ